jgi:hypothetical protein
VYLLDTGTVSTVLCKENFERVNTKENNSKDFKKFNEKKRNIDYKKNILGFRVKRGMQNDKTHIPKTPMFIF